MKRIRRSATAAIVGLGALALLAAPSFAASDQGATRAGGSVQLAHMGQGGNNQAMGQRCPMGMMGPGMMGPGMGGQGMMGPGMGGQGMMGPGQGYGQQPGYGMGPGTMGPGMGGGQGMMGQGFGSHVVPSRDLTADDVRHFLEHRLELHGNKRLKVGDVQEADDDKITADITTVDGSLVQRLEVDRHSGKMQHVD